MNTEQSFGDWLREVREGEGWTQVELANRMGVDQTLVSKVELGKNEPSEWFAIALARALNPDKPLIDYVLEKAGYVDERKMNDAPKDIDDKAEEDAIYQFTRLLRRIGDSTERRNTLQSVFTLMSAAARRSKRADGVPVR